MLHQILIYLNIFTRINRIEDVHFLDQGNSMLHQFSKK